MAKNQAGKKCGNGLYEKHKLTLQNPGQIVQDFF
jgi:hypothetical protein